MIRTENVQKRYGSGENAYTALQGITLSIQDGERIAIIGKSGSGKSTLMHLLAALDRPSQGEVYYDDVLLSKMHGKALNKLRNDKIGFVFQQFFLQPYFSSIENVALPLKIKGVSVHERRRKAIAMLQEVDMADKAKSRAIDLSGGQKQRLCIARAMINEPKVIFADEPTGNLDTQTGAKIMDLLFTLNQTKNITLIVVTHDADLAAQFTRVLHIQDGQLNESHREEGNHENN